MLMQSVSNKVYFTNVCWSKELNDDLSIGNKKDKNNVDKSSMKILHKENTPFVQKQTTGSGSVHLNWLE